MYSFELLTPLDGVPTALQVVYADQRDGNERLAATGLADLIESYNRRVPPTRLLFVCPSGLEDQIKQSFEQRRRELEGRLASASHVAIAPYDKCGRLIAEHVIHLKPGSPSWEIDDVLLERLAHNAVTGIFDDSKTILHAPHGYVFRKLSNREEEIFVRAGNMLRDPRCLVVFSYLLLRRLPTDCSIIYIDSFTILSFALGLQSLVDHFRRIDSSIPVLAIENFHSYELTPEFRIPNEADYLILISASMSGGLAHKLVSEKHADRNRIVHVLGVGSPDSDFRDSCVYFRERDPPDRTNSPSSQRNAIIEIGTEEFLVAQGPPTPVQITREHVNRDGARELNKSFYQEALKFHEPSVGGSYSTFSLSTDPADAENSPIRAWIGEMLVHELPASLRMLVHVDDSMSVRFASWLQDALPSEVAIKSLAELDQTSGFPSSRGAAVIVAYQDPGLERLREANIALRRIDPVHRHYVLGYAFPAARSEHRRLKADLQMGPSGPQYGWSEYLILPVGAAPLHESLVPRYELLSDEAIESSRTNLGDKLTDALRARNGQSSIPHDGLFLPRTDGNPLILRHGSVFFPDSLTQPVSQIAVHAMVSAAVQAAREFDAQGIRRERTSRPRFDDNPFVRSVLDPSMFARFNDGVLQASLLRSTQRSELDYSASDDLSQQFASICESILSSHSDDAGDAALEFVCALATRKISVRPPDFGRLQKQINANPALDAFNQLLKRDPEMLPISNQGNNSIAEDGQGGGTMSGAGASDS